MDRLEKLIELCRRSGDECVVREEDGKLILDVRRLTRVGDMFRSVYRGMARSSWGMDEDGSTSWLFVDLPRFLRAFPEARRVALEERDGEVCAVFELSPRVVLQACWERKYGKGRVVEHSIELSPVVKKRIERLRKAGITPFFEIKEWIDNYSFNDGASLTVGAYRRVLRKTDSGEYWVGEYVDITPDMRLAAETPLFE
ncbi:MAG: hypothetical protein DRJ67_05270 [Thermoprotei archaeon]|nr:MAG: hypothetical protein DRJ67_05270 [Thermoprotei archaeon]